METDTHNKQIKTPVVFLVFNRPRQTQLVFNTIKKAQPKRLFIVADGPRHDDDKIKCDQVRNIVQQVDWDCDVASLFRDTNLGCRESVSSGISWAFKNTDRAIILEDDTLPHETFFRYCDELLEHYKDDDRIMNISGVNFSNTNIKESYYFSNIPQIWGWATWKRAWEHYDIDMKMWPQARDQKLINKIFGNSPTADYWNFLFEQLYNGKVKKSAWDAQWVFACMINGGISINPASNLVTNIGFGDDATLSVDSDSPLSMYPVKAIRFPMVHPKTKNINTTADENTMKTVFRVNNTLAKKIRWTIKTKFPATYDLIKKINRIRTSK